MANLVKHRIKTFRFQNLNDAWPNRQLDFSTVFLPAPKESTTITSFNFSHGFSGVEQPIPLARQDQQLIDFCLARNRFLSEEDVEWCEWVPRLQLFTISDQSLTCLSHCPQWPCATFAQTLTMQFDFYFLERIEQPFGGAVNESKSISKDAFTKILRITYIKQYFHSIDRTLVLCLCARHFAFWSRPSSNGDLFVTTLKVLHCPWRLSVVQGICSRERSK